MMATTRYVKKTLCVLGLSAFFAVDTAEAAKKSGPSMSASSGSKSVDRDYLFSMPVAADRPQIRPHLEINLAGEAGLAVEAGIIGEVEELGSKEVEETGNSMKVKGAQATLLLSRYSEGNRLGGFFWTLGAGYRQFTADWKKKPEEKETSIRLSTQDQDGYLHHRIAGSGVVGVGRVGYRYVAAEWPLSIGAHIGMRHMNSTIKDVEVDQSEQEEMKLQYSPLNDVEKKSVKNRMMTSPDFAIEFGLIF